MKSILKATAILGSASVVSVLTGLLSAKVTAVLIGPTGLGYLGLLQSLLGLVVLIAGMGIGTGLVRIGARSLAEGQPDKMAALRRAAWLLSASFGGATALLMIAARVPLSRWMLGTPNHGAAVAITALGLLLMLAAGVQTGLLNAHHRVGVLARCSMLSSVMGTLLNLFIIWRWRAAGIPWAVLASSFFTWGVSAFYLHRCLPRAGARPSSGDVFTAAKGLVRFGLPFTASMLVGTGVVTALPILVLHVLDTTAVGLYRAAAAVSVNYLAVVTALMAQDYYPRASAAGNDRGALCHLINEQHRFVLLLGGPIVLGMLALVPYLVPLMYSSRFVGSVDLLEWQLIGDIFKLAAWTLSFVILARSGSLTFFFIEFVAGTSLLAFSWIGASWLGLEGLGIGFLACAVVYYVLCWLILRSSIGLRWTKHNLALLLSLVGLAVVIRALPYLGVANVRTPIALGLAALTGLYSLQAIWKEVGGLRGIFAHRRNDSPTTSGVAAMDATGMVSMEAGPLP